MPTFRGTIFFEQQGYGWTESYFKSALDLTPQAAAVALVDLAKARQGIMGKECSIKAARVSQEGVFRDALFADLGAVLVGEPTKAADAPDTALLLNCHTVGGTKRKIVYLRGIWDSVVDTGGIYTPTAPWTARLNAFITKLTQGAWGWMTRTSRVTANVSNVVPTVLAGTVGVTTETPLFNPLPPGVAFPFWTRVQISGVKGSYQINGSQLVSAKTQTTMVTKNRIAIFDYTAGGKATWSVLAFQQIEAAEVLRVIERRVGRPSYLSRGRRSATVRS